MLSGLSLLWYANKHSFLAHVTGMSENDCGLVSAVSAGSDTQHLPQWHRGNISLSVLCECFWLIFFPSNRFVRSKRFQRIGLRCTTHFAQCWSWQTESSSRKEYPWQVIASENKPKHDRWVGGECYPSCADWRGALSVWHPYAAATPMWLIETPSGFDANIGVTGWFQISALFLKESSQ